MLDALKLLSKSSYAFKLLQYKCLESMNNQDLLITCCDTTAMLIDNCFFNFNENYLKLKLFQICGIVHNAVSIDTQEFKSNSKMSCYTCD